ncbi:multidrug effflux MFS transporter [Tessaracoccus sp. HDW20]|nr:MFS transporter [Tessaracoccus coleopterorum]NHB86034.1 multidrug effflux MFS transporter [Tessaracoccus coleopterorum]
MESDLGRRYSRRRRIAIIVTLGLLTGLGPFTIDLYLPAFPVIKDEWTLTDAQIQITLSATTFGFALGQLIVGPLSDRLGRRWPLVVCSTLHVVSSVLVAVAQASGSSPRCGCCRASGRGRFGGGNGDGARPVQRAPAGGDAVQARAHLRPGADHRAHRGVVDGELHAVARHLLGAGWLRRPRGDPGARDDGGNQAPAQRTRAAWANC